MKKVLSLITSAALLTSVVPGISQLANHANAKLVNDKQKYNKMSNYVPHITTNDKMWTQVMNNLPKNLKSGNQNYYDWYFFYHVIGLSHDTVKDITRVLSSGISAVGAILSASIFGIGPIVSVVAALLLLQWAAWDIPGHDNGIGVVIKMIGGTLPQIIVGVSAQ